MSDDTLTPFSTPRRTWRATVRIHGSDRTLPAFFDSPEEALKAALAYADDRTVGTPRDEVPGQVWIMV